MEKKTPISSYKDKRALLVGNGVNRMDKSQAISWKDLLLKLREDLKIETDLDNKFKPFPLGFEEMLHEAGESQFEERLRNLKKKISQSIIKQLEGKKGYNKYHIDLMKLDYDDYLTTNYDYALEKALIDNDELILSQEAIYRKEHKYSLRRGYKFKNTQKKIWHIHGELIDARNLTDGSRYYHEESIMIGYEHYSSYLEKIQSNIKGSSKRNSEPEKNGLNDRIINDTNDIFWVDKFFTHNLDIVGLSLDFSENHLWWLLNYRANLIRKKNKEKDRIEFNNTIRFFYPSLSEPSMAELTRNREKADEIMDSIEKEKAIGDILKAFCVQVNPIDCANRREFYELLITKYLL